MSEPYKNIDDLFRDKFENFEQDPPEYVWDNIKTGIQNPKGPGGHGFNGGGLAGFTALLIIIGTILVYLLSNSFTINLPEKGSETSPTAQESFMDDTQIDTNPVIAQDIKVTAEIEESENRLQKEQESEYSVQENMESSMLPKKSIPEERVGKSTLMALSRTERIKQTNQQAPPSPNENKLSSLKYINFEYNGLGQTNQSDVRLNHKPSSFISTVPAPPRDDYVTKGQWSVGLYFRPEMIRYPSDDQITNYARGIDLHVLYKKNEYFLQTGLGFSQVTDAGNYKIDYNKYMGSYEDVYDVTFDTIGNEVTPVYHTQTVDVYDSINYVRITPSERRYTYLQIPIMFGYGKDYRRFGWFVKAGPALALMVHENIPEMSMREDQYKILNVENSLPARINANWQFVLSAGANYKLGNKISLSVEPLIRYYINSDYEPGKYTTRHPYSLGLRTGLLFNF
ncbi:MAG: PorT family protein [Bacteroidetes bacterium]|nr:PorT family protein [Bacteroidota bacterium]